MNFRTVVFPILVCLAMLRPGSAAEAPAGAPRLVVVIAIDAFRFDYLTRFESEFTPGGFKRLLQQGASFSNAHIDHFRASTGPGHAAMLTGASGRYSGVVDNSWYARSLGQEVNCVEDRDVRLLAQGTHAAHDGRSPRNLLVSTVGDELKLATDFRAKVFGVSYKDRGAILPAGKIADAAYWYDDATGEFISSTYYMESLPEWVDAFNQRKIPDQFFGKNWDRVHTEANNQSFARADDFAHELDYKGMGRTFPHPLTGGLQQPGEDFYKAFAQTPFADSHLAEFAKSMIAHEELGADEVTDLFTISFSATDRIGHQFGPYSHEQRDQILRLDRVLADLLDFVDAEVGLAHTIICLTADHGCGPIPEFISQFGFDAGRIDASDIPEGEDSVIIPHTVDLALDQTFGEGDWVAAFIKPNLYFNYAVLDSLEVADQDVEDVAANALLALPGIGDVFVRSRLLSGLYANTRTAERVIRQYHPQRSGDLVVHNKPYYVTAAYKKSKNKGADHETSYPYDTHIPCIFFGKAFKAGSYSKTVTLNDMAPTLANVLGLAIPSGNEGRVLHECLHSN